MFFRSLALCPALVLLACTDPAPNPDASMLDGAVDAAVDAPDGSVPAIDRPATLSPLACQASIEVLRTETFDVQDHPLPYDGEFYGVREGGLFALASDRLIAEDGATVDGFDDLTLAFDRTDIATAPDHGDQNSPPFPVAFTAFMRGTGGLINRPVILASDGVSDIRKVIAVGDPFSATSAAGSPIVGTVDAFRELRMDPEGAIWFFLDLEESMLTYLVRVDSPGEPPRVVIEEDGALDDEYRLGELQYYTLSEFGPIVRAQVRGPMPSLDDFVYVTAFWFGDVECVATNTPVTCGLTFASVTPLSVDDFGSDVSATGVVNRTDSGSPVLEYKLVTGPGEIRRLEETQGFTFNNFSHPRACGRDNTLYFVGTVVGDRGTYDELFKLRAGGLLTQVTDFGALLNPALEGEVPDEILSFALGYGCDAVLRTRGEVRDGTTPYEGYWVSYFEGDTMEVIDETPGRADNGNGSLTGVGRARSGVDANADARTEAHIGPDGAFTFFIRNGDGVGDGGRYARATQPTDRCRAPNIVNTDDDTDDLVPGDGRCDTGTTVGTDPACSFRAAIQETNAAPGSDTIQFDGPRAITLDDPLPTIVSALEIEGGDSSVSGAMLEPGAHGLDIAAPGVRVRDLRFEQCPGDGLHASPYVTLENVESASNCGWGFWLEGGATITGARLVDNGAGDACQAGGLFAPNQDATMRVSGLLANDNDGPGVLTQSALRAADVEASDNAGDGVVVAGNALTVSHSVLNARGNRGHGLRVAGPLRTENANLLVQDNCGWGLWVEDFAPILEPPYGAAPPPHTVSNNGRTPAGGGGGVFWDVDESAPTSMTRSCGGGGISVVDVEGEDGGRARSIRIADNQGPGIASTGGWWLSDARVTGNFGPGVLIWGPEERGRALTVLLESPMPTLFEGNIGAGVEVREGDIVFEGDVESSSNVGVGVVTWEGNLALNLTASFPGTTTVRANGTAGIECQPWSYRDSDGTWVQEPSAVCDPNAGIATLEGDITARAPVVRENAGAGVIARDPGDDGLGVATITGGSVCGNGAADEVVTMSYTDVDTGC